MSQPTKTVSDLENERQQALDMVEAVYYTPTSPHYKDNERYSWAIKAIHETFATKIANIKRENNLNQLK